MKGARGCLIVLGVVITLGIYITILRLTWPVCLPTVLAAAGWFFTGVSKGSFKSAAHELLGPITIGLLFLSALLLFVNGAPPPTPLIGNAHLIGNVERALVYVDNGLPSWSKLSPIAFVFAIACLMALTYWMPRLKLITKFVAVNKFSSKATTALGAATSFTFFSSVAVVQPKVPAIYLKIEAVYRNSKEAQRKSVDRFLAAKTVQRAIMSQDRSGRDYCRFLVEGIAAIPTMDLVSKRALAGYGAQQLYHQIELPAKGGEAGIGATLLPHRSALTLLDGQVATERTASELADEAVEATKELFSNTLDLGSEEIKSIGWSFVDTLIAQQSNAFDQLARPFIDKIIDKYFEKYTDPIVTKQSEAVRHLFERPGNGPTAAKVAANSETKSAMVLMNAREAELARDAAHQALEAAQAAKTAASAGDTGRADAELSNAERASAQALKAADLAKAASESMATVSEALRTASGEAGAVTFAIGAVEAAELVRIATETAEAVKIAKSAAEAVEAAKVARAAAEAAEAVRSLWTVSPK